MANWLAFDRFAEWDFLVWTGFAYDAISDEAIAAALADTAHLDQVDTALDWEDDQWLAACPAIPEADKHAYRIAALVRQFRSGQLMTNTISVDTFAAGRCPSAVCNGHHRIRALQYLGLTAGPFDLSGLLEYLEDLVSLARVTPPPLAAAFVHPRLLVPAEEDVTLPWDPVAPQGGDSPEVSNPACPC